MGTPSHWGYGGTRRNPTAIKVWVGIGPAGEMVNVTDWIDRYTAEITTNEDQEGRKTTFRVNFLQEVGNQYDIPSKVPVWVYSDATEDLNTDSSYMRIFSGFTYSPDAETPGDPLERFIGIQAVGMEELAENPPRTVVDWPPADGTPVVATNTNASIAPGLSVEIEPQDTHNMYVGKRLYLIEPVAEYPHQERVEITDINLAARKTVATAITNGTHTVTPSSMTGITAGMRLFCCNKNGHNPETITVTSVTGTTFTATFAIGKSVNWLVLPGTITLAQVTHTYTYSHTTVASPALSGIDVVVTPASLTNLSVGTLVTVKNSDGTSREVSQITAVGGSTVTLDLQTAKTAGWYMDVLPLVTGIVSTTELFADGWYQEIAGELVFVDSLLDECYTNATPSYAVNKNAIADIELSYGVLKYDAATPAQVYRDMLKYAPVIDTIVDTSATAGTHVITPRSNLGISIGKQLTVYNEDGTNYEVVTVTAMSYATFTVTLTSSKAAGWHVRGFVIPRTYHNVISDNPAHNALWTYVPHLYDAAAPTNLTAYEISDEVPADFDSATQVRFEKYKLNHTGDGKQNRQTVRGKNNALGSYQDDIDINGLPGRVGIGRSIEPAPVYLDFVFTNEQAAEEAKRIVWKNNRDFIQLDIESPSCIDNYVLTEPKWGTVILPYEPESPFNLPLVTAHLTFPNGIAKWQYTFGDPRQLYGISPVTAEEVAGVKIPRTFMHQIVITEPEYTVRHGGTTYFVDASNNDVTVYLPSAAFDPTMRTEFKRIDDGTSGFGVSIVAANGEVVA